LPSLQETRRASEDPNLPIDDRRKIILPYKQRRNTNKQAYDKIYVAGGADLMREAPTKFWRSEKLITKEGYPTNQNPENNQLKPSHKKPTLWETPI